MSTLKTKLSLTVYGNTVAEVENAALEQLSKYFEIESDDLVEFLDTELLVQTRAHDDEASEKVFKATVYSSIKRSAVNFAK